MNPNDPNPPADAAEPTTVMPSALPTEVLVPATAATSPGEVLRRPRDNRGRRSKLRITKRGRVLLIVGIAVVVVLALVAGLLVANTLARQGAAAELEDARTAATEAERDFHAATTAAEETLATLTSLIEAAEAGLAITGAGLDEAARAPFTESIETAKAAATADAEPAGLAEAPDAAADPSPDERANAEAFRERAEALEANTASELERAERLESATEFLGSAITGYLSSTAVAGAALLADHGDAADELRAALQQQIDGLVPSDPAAFVETLTAYRAAVDDVVGSSEAARTPGGSGIRVPDPTSITAVVNKRRGLAADYVPPGLVTPSGIPGGYPVRSELIEPLEQMRAAMAAEGITLRISSAYRPYSSQERIYNGFVAREGVAGADTHSARPGNSEHQTGLAVDFDDGTGCNLSACFGGKPGGIWLAANSWKYGFILRYGDGWHPIVGYSYEPWHYRYVGVDVATDMHERGIRTLEEYFGLEAAPDYG